MAEPQLLVQNIGGVTVVNFSVGAILDEPTIESLGKRLYALVDEQAQRKILLGLSQVRFLSSSLLGVLLNLRKKSQGIKGRLAIVGLRPKLREVFRISRTDKLFEFYEDEQEALHSFGA